MRPKIYTTSYGGGRIWLYAVLFGLAALSGNFLGCEPENFSFEVNCNDCYSFQPDSANLVVNLSINSEYDSIPLTFYKGPYEDGVIDWQDTATEEEFYLYSELDARYTIRAEYKSGDKTIFAFDNDKMRISDAGDECGSPCYIVKGGIFDLRLKEGK